MAAESSTVSGEWIHFPAQGTNFRAYMVRPRQAPPWPALIVIHGVNGCGIHMQNRAVEFAAEGYFAICPDIYSNDPVFPTVPEGDILDAAHMGPNRAKHAAYLTDKTPERRAAIARARAWIDSRPGASFIEIVRGCYDYLKARKDVAAIGSVGYCMGGRLTGELAATGAELAAGVIYYGGNPKLELVPNIRCPIEGHYAVTDHGITDKVPLFAEAMKNAGKEFASFVYDADHGFSLTPGSHGYNEAATRLSMHRTFAFLARTLKMASLAPA
jgi:carboxymethylenebutenolidase